MTPLVIQRDKAGHPIDWNAAVIEAVETFELPGCWPAGNEDCRKLLYDYSSIFGAAVALGLNTTDAAYFWIKAHCQSVQDSTMGSVRWRDTYPFCIHLLDSTTRRVSEYLALQDNRALLILRRVAIQAINAGLPTDTVRNSVADAAEKIDPMPPISLLHDAINGAAAECRRNARWMTTRETK